MSTRRQWFWSRGKRRLRASSGLVVALLVAATGTLVPGCRLLLAAEVEIPATTPFDEPLVLQARALRGLRASVIGEILTGEDGGELTIAALAVPAPGDDRASDVPIAVEIDGSGFLESNSRDLARLEVYVYALGAERQIADFLADVFAVDVGLHGERIWQSGFEYFGRLRLPTGEYRLRILVRDYHSGAQGLATRELVVPGFAHGEAAALTPLFPEPAGRDVWIPVRSWAGREGGGHPEYPLLALGRDVNPASKPVLVSGRKAVVWLPIVGLTTGVVGGEIRFLAGGVQGEEVAARAVPDSVTAGESVAAGVQIFEIGFVPPDVVPGTYRARTEVTTAAGGVLRADDIDVFVTDQEIREAGLLWSDMRWLLESDVRPAQPPPVEQRGTRRGARAERKRKRAEAEERQRVRSEMAERYRALVDNASGSASEVTLAALLGLEAEALRGDIGGNLETLRKVELSVAESVGRELPDAVLSIAVLHGDMYSRYRGRRMYSLMDHTRSLLEDLSQLYVDLGGERDTGARILINLAGHLQDANLAGSSRRLFGKALELDPDSDAALLGLAVSHERYGEYTQAIGYLEQLVIAAPSFNEGHLRLAVNLERVGLLRRTLDIHQRLVASGGSDWVAALAAQELARLFMRTENLARAAETLEVAVARMPERGGSRILLAHVYDRLGFTRQALDQLGEVDPAPGSRRSARLLYDRWPQDLLERSRALLRDEAARAAHGTTPGASPDTSGETSR